MARSNPSILFVCLGNICRSPMAEGALRQAADAAGLALTIDSAGTSAYHIGSPPDGRAIRTAALHGANIAGLRGRQVAAADFERFDLILALDEANLADLRDRASADCRAEIALLMDCVPGRAGEAVADPYYGGEEGFEETWADVAAAAQALVKRFGG